jgi:hypothetical protein
MNLTAVLRTSKTVLDYFGPWNVGYQQAQRRIRARCFEAVVEDLRMLLREFAGRSPRP